MKLLFSLSFIVMALFMYMAIIGGIFSSPLLPFVMIPFLVLGSVMLTVEYITDLHEKRK